MQETKFHHIVMYLTFFSLGMLTTAIAITQGFFQLTSDPICFSSTHGILMSLGYTAFTLGKANKGQKGTYFQSKAI